MSICQSRYLADDHLYSAMDARKKKFNVLIIMTDNQPADLLGCYGNTEIYTPHLDQLAQQGMKFHNAFCPNEMCSPSRASLLSAAIII